MALAANFLDIEALIEQVLIQRDHLAECVARFERYRKKNNLDDPDGK